MIKNPFSYTDTNKRYHTYDYYLKHKYGTKCARIPIDAGFSCPNREDGGTGCIYCSARGSGDFCADHLLSPQAQFAREYARLSEKWGARLPAIPYFQAFSGTYAPLDTLKAVYDEVPYYRDGNGEPVPIPAMIIATRPDCITEEITAYLAALDQTLDVSVELGLQSAHDKTLTRIGRGHDFAAFMRGYRMLKNAGIPVCVHIINGLPGETETDMSETVRILAAQRPDFVKIHMLHVLKNTPLAAMWEAGDIPLLSQEDYVRIVCKQLEMLPPETVICRLTGDGAAAELLAPDWTRNKRAVLASIDKTLAQNNTYQGKEFSS